jgi:hypothetical protein
VTANGPSFEKRHVPGRPYFDRLKHLHMIASDPERKRRCVDRALKYFEQRGTFHGINEIVGVGTKTLRSWINADPAARERFLEIDGDVTEEVEQIAIDACRRGDDNKIVAFMLERRSDRYKPRVEVKSTQAMTIDGMADRFRQAALANPTLVPILRQALQLAMDRLPDTALEHEVTEVTDDGV